MKNYIDTGVYLSILEERARQDEEWGGPAHDDQHSGSEWLNFINHQVHRARDCDAVNQQFRDRLIKIASLAIAAAESFDRRYSFDWRVQGRQYFAAIAEGEARMNRPQGRLATAAEVEREQLDELAVTAMRAILAGPMVQGMTMTPFPPLFCDHITDTAYKIARAMIEKRKEQQ